MPSTSTSPLRALRPLSSAFALLLPILASACSQAQEEGPYRHVLLITLDTLRADHLSCYGGTAVPTPHIDAIAAEGTRFADVTTAAPTTLASHTSIMTGLYPRRHGVPRNGFMVPQENLMLAEVFQQAGFHTAAFLGSFALDQMFDFDQGFAAWDQDFDIEFSPRGADQNQRRAAAVTDAVLAHVDAVGEGERLFLFAHYFDAHAPYDPPSPFAEEYAAPGGKTTSDLRDVTVQVLRHQEAAGDLRRDVFTHGLSRKLLRKSAGTPLEGDADLAGLYAGEVAYLDHHLGRLFDGLRERGVLDDCVVVLTADHGETFWEHGDHWHHGAWLYQTNVHVPLIVRLPDGRGAGRVVEGVASTTDIFPTLVELLGLECSEAVDGQSLLPGLDGGELPERTVYTEATQPVARELEAAERWANQRKPRAARKGSWKLIEAPYLGLSQLFDLERDPGERQDLELESTPRAEVERPLLSRELSRWSAVQEPRPSRFNRAQMDEVKRRLEALGYTGNR